MPRGLGEGGHLELEEEQGLLPDEVEPRIEHLEGGSMEQVRERSMGLPQLRIEDVLRQGRRGDGDREEARTPLSNEGPQLRDRERLQWPREEESLARRGEVLAGGVDEGRELFDADRAGDVAVRVDRIDDDQRLREGPRGQTLQHDDRPGPPGKTAVQDPAEAGVLQDEELAEVAAETEHLGLGPVHADPFGPRLQQSNLVRLPFLHMSEDVVHVEGRAVDRAHALGRVRDPIAGDDLDLEAAVPAAGVRMLRVHPHGPLEHVAEGEARPRQSLSRGVGRERHEDVDLGPGEVHALRDGSDEQRFRREALGRDLGFEDSHHVADDALDAAVLLRRRQDFPEDRVLEPRHRARIRWPYLESRSGGDGQPRSLLSRAAAMMPAMTKCTAMAARRSPMMRPNARAPVRPILRKIRSALCNSTRAERTATRMPAKTNILSAKSDTGAVM